MEQVVHITKYFFTIATAYNYCYHLGQDLTMSVFIESPTKNFSVN